jgi:type IV pilus assembly protein PilE
MLKLSKYTQAGVTLIELLIVMIIIGIMTAIALPAYGNFVTRGYRTEAQGSLVQASQFMQRVRTEQGSYAPSGVTPTLSGALAQSPPIGNARYNLSVTSTASTFTLTATPTSLMPASEPCGALTIDHTGLKTFGNGAGDLKTCWGL